MNENPTRKCPRCGMEIALAAEAVCPRCAAGLLRATPTEASVGGEGTPPFTPPTVDDLEAKFPQLEILTFIGKGGMGAVYKARQRQLDRVVALKILPPGVGDEPTFAERFAREAKALAKLNHPGIVTIYDFGRSDGLFYFLMEFVDGVSLSELIQRGRVSSREALAIVPQICDALQYAHDQGIVHRDIKPENILLDRRGRVKVADFGLAKLMEPGSELGVAKGAAATGSPNLTEAGKVMGTPQYMAPEQREHPTEVDHRADIYALGVVFYQMLTGALPGKPIEPPSKKVRVDVRLDEVVLRALETEPQRRYQQASQVKTAVETITQSPRPSAQEPEAGTVRETSASSGAGAVPAARRQWRRILAGAAMSAMALFAIWAVLRVVWKRGPGVSTPVLVVPAAKGDIGNYLGCLGTVESSNSVSFSIPEDFVQEAVKKFDARQSLPVEAYDRANAIRFGHGFLVGVDNRIDTTTGMLTCKAKLVPDGGNLMVPGLFLNIRMLLEEKHGVILVPTIAIQRGPQGVFVWVIQPDLTVTRRLAQLGTIEGEKAEIQAGLQPGELVAMNGFERLSEGCRVTYTLVQLGATKAKTTPTASPASVQTGAFVGNRELLQVQLRQAETEVARLKPLHDAKVISDSEFQAAQDTKEVLQATLDGDPIRAAQIRLASAERELRRVSELFTNKLVPGSELEAAEAEVQKRQIELKTTQAARGTGATFGPVIERR